MAWQSVLTTMVRHLIGDVSDTPTYEDDRIQQALVVSGLISSQEYNFNVSYTFDIDSITMSPDPTITATIDAAAMALFTLKTACMLNMNSYQKAVGAGIRVKDGDSEVDTTSAFKGYKDIIGSGPCAAYSKLLKQLHFGRSIGKAVMSPPTITDASVWGRMSVVDFFDHLRG